MSKQLSFRAKALDASKPMPIYMAEELPDLPDYSAINRAVPQMPSGMEKEEECEHHLQRAICTGLIIPTPEVADVSDIEFYDRIYPSNYKMPRQLIHMQSFAMEQDIPDYDMDSEDEMWFNAQRNKLDITPLKFEEMMDRLEKGSGQTVLSVQEAKLLLKDDDDLILAVYDYWLNKRLKTQHPLIPTVRTEHRAGSVANNPYVAFRRRMEKMQTRKNRKNDEASYEKMLKLKRDLSRAVTLLELVKRREKSKRELLHLTVEVFEKRYQAGDFSGQMLAEVSTVKPAPRPAFTPLFPGQFTANNQTWPTKDEALGRKEKRQYKRRKHKAGVPGGLGGVGGALGVSGVGAAGVAGASAAGLGVVVAGGSLRSASSSAGLDVSLLGDGVLSSSEDGEGTSPAAVSDEDEDGDEGPFAFRRRKNCSYHAPLSQGLGNWPWCGREEGGLADRRFRYSLASLGPASAALPGPGRGQARRCVGLARRRVGRGGRVILDRALADPALGDLFAALDFTILDSEAEGAEKKLGLDEDQQALLQEVRGWPHFRPATPPPALPEPEGLEEEDPWALCSPSELHLHLEPAEGAWSKEWAGETAELSLAEALAVASAEVGEDNLQANAAAHDDDDENPSNEEEEFSDVGCSRFRVHSERSSRRPPPPPALQMWGGGSSAAAATTSGTVSAAGLPAPGPGRPPPSAPPTPSQQQQPPHRKRQRHHSGGQGGRGALSNGVGAVSALLLGGMSNGPMSAVAGGAAGTLTALPALLVKHEVKQEPSDYDFVGSNSAPSPMSDGGVVGASPSGDASGACAEQQKLKATQQAQLPMEVT